MNNSKTIFDVLMTEHAATACSVSSSSVFCGHFARNLIPCNGFFESKR